MMMITRTESRIEFGFGEHNTISIDVARLTSSMLAAERMPCGRMHYALLLITDASAEPVRIEGDPEQLMTMHEYVVETMASAESPVMAGTCALH